VFESHAAVRTRLAGSRVAFAGAQQSQRRNRDQKRSEPSRPACPPAGREYVRRGMRHCGRHGAAKLESGLLTDCDRGRISHGHESRTAANEDGAGPNAICRGLMQGRKSRPPRHSARSRGYGAAVDRQACSSRTGISAPGCVTMLVPSWNSACWDGGGRQIERRPTPVSALNNRCDPHASRGAGGDEPPARVGITGEDLGQPADDVGGWLTRRLRSESFFGGHCMPQRKACGRMEAGSAK
jgi:hypothetical protein